MLLWNAKCIVIKYRIRNSFFVSVNRNIRVFRYEKSCFDGIWEDINLCKVLKIKAVLIVCHKFRIDIVFLLGLL